MLFGTSNNPMCHIFLILSYVYISLVWIIYFFNPFFFSYQSNHCLTGNAFYHIQHIITNAICQRLIPQQHNKTTPPMVSQCLHRAAPLLPPCSQQLSSLAAHCLPLAAQCWCWPLPLDTWSVIRLWSVRHPLSKQNKIRWAFFASIGQIQFLPRQGSNSWKWPTATVTVIANGDGNCNGRWWRRRQWPMARATAMATAMADGDAKKTAAAMVNGNRNRNGRRQRRWAMATAMVMELVTTMEMAMAIAMATAMARVTMTKAGLHLHVPGMCSTMAGATPCLHPYGHKWKCIHQRCIMGVTLLRSLSRGRVPDSSPWILFFVYFLQLLFSLLNNPLFIPCIIQALKNPVSPLTLYLLHSSKNTVSLLTIYPSSYWTFCQGKPRQGLQWL